MSGLRGGQRTAPQRWALRLGVFTSVAVCVTGIVSGCGATPSPARTASPTPVASAAPVLDPDGTAEDNLPYFTVVVDQVWAGSAKGRALAYIDALTDAGFTRTDMQMTADVTTVGNPAESIQFSVRWGDESCLVGQVGPSTGNPVAVVLPQLSGGRCLIGATPDVGGNE